MSSIILSYEVILSCHQSSYHTKPSDILSPVILSYEVISHPIIRSHQSSYHVINHPIIRSHQTSYHVTGHTIIRSHQSTHYTKSSVIISYEVISHPVISHRSSYHMNSSVMLSYEVIHSESLTANYNCFVMVLFCRWLHCAKALRCSPLRNFRYRFVCRRRSANTL